MPEVFYSMEMDEFWLMYEGWVDDKTHFEGLLRRHAYIIHASMVSNPAALERLWPMGEKRSTKITDSQREKLAKLRAKDKLNGSTN